MELVIEKLARSLAAEWTSLLCLGDLAVNSSEDLTERTLNIMKEHLKDSMKGPHECFPQPDGSGERMRNEFFPPRRLPKPPR